MKISIGAALKIVTNIGKIDRELPVQESVPFTEGYKAVEASGIKFVEELKEHIEDTSRIERVRANIRDRIASVNHTNGLNTSMTELSAIDRSLSDFSSMVYYASPPPRSAVTEQKLNHMMETFNATEVAERKVPSEVKADMSESVSAIFDDVITTLKFRRDEVEAQRNAANYDSYIELSPEDVETLVKFKVIPPPK